MARKTGPESLVDTPFELEGLDNLDKDPQPAAPKRGPGRPRKATSGAAPARRRSAPARTSSGRIMSKDQMKAKVSAELYGLAALMAGGWAMRDPCAETLFETSNIGGVDQERLTVIVERTVALIARNDAALEFCAKSGALGETLALATALWPVAKAIYQAHGPGGHGHRLDEGMLHADYANAYPPFVGAGAAA